VSWRLPADSPTPGGESGTGPATDTTGDPEFETPQLPPPTPPPQTRRDGNSIGQWKVVFATTTTLLEKKWDRLLPDAEISTDTTGWPNGCIGTGGSIATTLRGLTHTPDFVIIDGEATHPSTTNMLGARRL
jgi:hypothetical protein